MLDANRDIYPDVVKLEESNIRYINTKTALRPEPIYTWFKRALDVTLSLIALLILALPMAVIALAIKLTSPGPIFFRQKRLGKDCKPFTIYKFRTMYNNTPTALHKEYIQKLIQTEQQAASNIIWLPPSNDKRVTRLGHWLRLTGLDELPQLFNVIRGDMSLVGPRPPLEYEVELYQDWQYRRMSIEPGITGLWQVSARGKCSFEEMVKLDLDYIERRNLALDCWIILITVPSRLAKSLSYHR